MKQEDKHKWSCWQCGDRIGKTFVLWSLNYKIDRVFIICSKEFCLKMVKSGGEKVYIIKGKTR